MEQKDIPIGSLLILTRKYRISKNSLTSRVCEEYETIGLVVEHLANNNIFVEWLHNSWYYPHTERELCVLSLDHGIFNNQATIQKPE